MTAKVLPKKTVTAGKVPSTTDLDLGEIAINYEDGVLYGRHPNGTIVNLTGALELHNHSISQVSGLQTALNGKVGTGDSRLTNSREWTASTVTQAEAEAGTATTRRAWTSQRVRQAINAVVNAIGNATTTVKGWMSPEDKTKLNGIATGATKNATDAQLRDRSTHTGTQAISTVSGLQTALDGKSATGHTHDDRYYTEAEIDAMFSGLTTTPDWSAVLNKPDTATRWPAWSEVTGKPSTYAPSAHTHTIANVTGLQVALDGKAASNHTHAYVPTSRTVNGKALSANISLTASDVGAAASSHNHTIANVDGLQTALDGKAASSHNHSAANITSGTLDGYRLPNATATVQGAVKVRLNGTTAYFTTNGSNA